MDVRYYRLSGATAHMLERQGKITQIQTLLASLSDRGLDQSQQNIFSTIRNSNCEVTVAEVGNVVVGVVTLNIIQTFRGRHGEINDLVVDHAYRGHGIGRSLMQGAQTSAWIKGCSHMYLTSAERRVEARSLYTSLGYELKDTGVFALERPRSL